MPSSIARTYSPNPDHAHFLARENHLGGTEELGQAAGFESLVF